MNRLCFLFLLCFASTITYGQEALDQLIKQNAGDADLVKRLKTFKSAGAEKYFDVSDFKPNDFIKTAKNYIGTPYKFGGTSKAGIDCSGLIVKTMEDLGLHAPHNANELAKYGKIILDKDELKPGDLIFFTRTYNTSRLVSHAGFVIEDDQMLHASSKGVNITSIHNPYYYDKYYLFGTRIFGDDEAVTMPVVVATTPTTAKPVTTGALKAGSMGSALAAIYDVKTRGKYTDSGEKYSGGALTISHPTLPFGAMVELTNPANGRTIVARVNDGDSGRDKIEFTLSKKTAKKLKIKKDQQVKIDFKVTSL
ncbi:MAG: C40 family peptidase [Cyclobacteriaceae bacterium]